MSKADCCSTKASEYPTGKYVCYCSKVTEADIIKAINSGANSIKKVIEVTKAMENSYCEINNPKGKCCYSDISLVFQKHS